LFALPAFGAPFLVSDPHPVCGNAGQPECPVMVEIFEDGVSIIDNHPVEADMSIRYDVGGRPTGEHTYAAKFIDQYGRKSELSDPFVLLSVSDAPQALNLTP